MLTTIKSSDKMIKKTKIKTYSLAEIKGHISEKSYKKVEAKVKLEDAILLLLSAIEYRKVVISRTLLMKEIFLLYEEILKPLKISEGAKEVGYVAYKFGPYSYQVNIAVASLILSGKVQQKNYYERQEHPDDIILDIKKGEKFLATYETTESFYNIAEKYNNTLKRISIKSNVLRDHIADKKLRWDQRCSMGIIRYVYSKYKEYIINSNLKEVYPDLFYGIIKEDRWLIYDRNRKY